MVKYEFGVMSCKYSLEAEDDRIADIAMSMFIGKNIPIAIYSPRSRGILPGEVLSNNEKTINKDKKDILVAFESIKKTS